MPAIERPDTNNYFNFYGIEQSFQIDAANLKKLFLEKSRQFHPDFYTHDPESQNIALAVSSFNNKAYKILGNEISRAQYLIELHLKEEDSKQALPNAFLMEMMDLNEAIDDLAYARDASKEAQLSAEIRHLKEDILADINSKAIEANWHDTQIAILKWKYLERLESRMHSLE